MLFPNPEFIFLFLPVVCVLYYFTPERQKNFLLLVASLLFYAWGEPIYVLLMLGSILANYLFGLAIDFYKESRKAWLIASVTFNLGLLIVFKYANFLADNFDVLITFLGLHPIALEPVHLPLGISFFTFHAMSYIFDVYRQQTEVQRRFSTVALYITLFPQLIAGPIVRYHDVAPQLVSRDPDAADVFNGIRRFLIGMAKKLLIANPIGQVADTIFSTPQSELGFALAWVGILCYALQIYFDFSGYSDMAIGLARMFGFRFLENFNYPYIAQSLQDFWRRWHISLSNWFRDYLYITLGGNRISPRRTYLNLFTVFFLCGLWHGASWNFIVWGLIHGSFLVLERAGLSRVLANLWQPVRHVYTLFVVCIAWVFFRAEDLTSALAYIGTLLGFGNGSPVAGELALLALQPDTVLAFLLGLLLCTPVYRELSKKYVIPAMCNRPVLYGVTQSVFVFGMTGINFLAAASTTYNPFIYFRF